MKINLKQLSEQKTETTTGSKKMKLSENAASMVFQLFTKNVYSNPIGTVVREITSNCFDSHVEAGVDTPVIIRKSFDEETSTHYISFIDFGVGMSPQRIEEVYMVYFESTKRVDNTQIGGFGIGGKTPLAYKRSTGQGEGEYDNSFYVITVHNGTKYYYCVYEGAESPEVSLLHTEETTEHNGTEIRIPVLEKDVETFVREMQRQLYYFENIIFEGFIEKDWRGDIVYEEDGKTPKSAVPNDYQIVRGKTFWFRGDKYDSNIHVCLGRVAYPIDYSALNLSSSDYHLPVAIKLEVGDIGVTASRESLDYSEETVKILKAKLKEVKEELVQLLKDQYSNVQTLADYFEVKENFGRLRLTEDKSIYIGNVIKKDEVDYSNFKYAYMGNIPDDSALFKLLFYAKLYGKREGRGYYSKHSFSQNYKGVLSASHLYYVEGEFKRKVVKQAYLKTQHERYYVISKNDIEDMRLATICDIFNVHLDGKVDDKGKTVPFIKGLLEMQEEYFEIIRQNAENYDELEVPEDFILERKREKLSEEVLKSTIPVKMIEAYYRTNQRVPVKYLVNFTGTIIYGHRDEESKLRDVKEVYSALFENARCVDGFSTHNDKGFGNKGGILFITISQSNAKIMEYCGKAYHVKDAYWKLLHRKEGYVKRYFNTYKIQERFDEIEDLYLLEDFQKLSATWGRKIADIKQFIQDLPEKAKNLDGHKWALKKFFDIDNVELDEEQVKYDKMIDEVLELQKKNEKTLEFISLPYRMDKIEGTLLMILAKVLSF